MIENRLVGIKSREIYEVPGALALITAHQELEDIVLTRDLLHFKKHHREQARRLIYEGQWFDPLTDACKAFLVSTQKRVTGERAPQVPQGQLRGRGCRKRLYSLYSYKLATYTKHQFAHTAAAGFIELWGLPIEVWAKVGKAHHMMKELEMEDEAATV